MTTKNTPLTLSPLKLTTYSPDDEVAKSFMEFEMFDSRHHFSVGLTQSGIAIMMRFVNKRAFSNKPSKGIRRMVTVKLVDASAYLTVAITRIRITIPAGVKDDFHRVDFPFAYSNICKDHTYKVIVTDDNSRETLGETSFNIYDELLYGEDTSRWYVVEAGGLCPEHEKEYYKSYNVETLSYPKVRFDILPKISPVPDILPELEIRVYFPDGTIDNSFCSPICDDFDMNEYHVEMPILINDSNKGICYAELLCLDYPIAGCVFNTKSGYHSGAWFGKNLECLDKYTLEAASERFRTAFSDNNNEKNDDMTDEEFEKALSEFIMDELGSSEDYEATDNESDTNSNNDNPGIEFQSEEVFNQRTPLSLNDLTGLTKVKEKFTTYEKIVSFNKMRMENNLPALSLPLHAVFLGSTGTGKTTVAKMMGEMLAKAGILSKGHVVIKERATLLGPNYSMEETNTLEAIEAAKGGILFIDEAYQLYQPNDPKDPGKFVIETLLTALADESNRDWMLILAGYPDVMRKLLEMNPGFKSRIPESNIYVFYDFTESQLLEIAERYFAREKYSLTEEARIALSRRLHSDYISRDKTFGNARYVINLIQTEIIPAMALRVVSNTDNDPRSLSEIQPCDIPQPKGLPHSHHFPIGFRA